MNILKRFEVWVLLLLAGGVIALVIATGGDDEPAPGDGSDSGAGADPGVAEASAAFTIDSARLKRDYGNGILELHITYDNRSDTELELVSPAARLLSGPDPGDGVSGEEISSFFLAFSPPPKLPAGKRSPAVLKFWLEKRHLESALWLRILDDTLPVKSATPLDLESLPNQETTIFDGKDWAAAP